MNVFTRMYEKIFVKQEVRELLEAYRAGKLTVFRSSIYRGKGWLEDHSYIVFLAPNGTLLKVKPDGKCYETNNKDEYHYFYYGYSLERLFDIALSDIDRQTKIKDAEYEIARSKEAEEKFVNLLKN